MEFDINVWVIILGICLLLCIVWNIVLSGKLSGFQKLKEPDLSEVPEIKESADIYERMIPGEMLKLLKVKQYSDLRVGDQQYFSSVIMRVDMVDLTGLVHSKKVNEVFASINSIMNLVIPTVYDHGGMVEEFQGGGFCAFFLEKYEQALTAAVSICESINENYGREQKLESVTVGLYYGPVMIGVVGHERRMTILTLSEAKEFANVLQQIGNRYDAKIVVTSKFLDQIKNCAGTFNYRLLGYAQIREINAIEKIYDVFDGDAAEVRNKKRKSKMVFEKGVELFAEQKLSEARRHFIEVLKMAPADKAAKDYLLRCDEYLNSEVDRSIFIETYEKVTKGETYAYDNQGTNEAV